MYLIGQWADVIICGGYLCILAVIDMRFRKIPIWMLGAGVGGAVIYQIVWSELPVVLSVAGGATGIVFLLCSKVTREALGFGDGILILALGIYLGFWKVISLLTIAFTLAAGFAMVVLVFKKFHRKAIFPFVPFLCTGYFLVLGMEAMKI